jgi:hypothetical protein
LEGKRMPSSGNAILGRAVHASTAVYDQSVIDGAGITIDEAAATVVDTIQKPNEEVDWDGENPSEAERIAISLHSKYCNLVAPKQNYKAVEVNCEQLEITDLGIALTGTTDRIRETENGFSIVDIKTGKTAVGADGTVKTAGHAYQLGVYELLAEQAGGLPIIGAAQIIGLNAAKTEAAQRVGEGEVLGARAVLTGDGESAGVLEMAAKLVHSGDFFGNPKSMMCNKKYCPVYQICKFRK